MRISKQFWFIFYFIISGAPILAQVKYPAARKEAFDTTIYKRKLADDYYWMSRKHNEKEVLEYSKQQGKLAQTILDSIPGNAVIENEWNESFSALDDEIWNGRAAGEYIYYSRIVPGEGTWYCRRKGLKGEEEKILKNIIIKGQKYSVRKRIAAYNKSLLALMLTQQGGEANPHIRIYDIDKKEFLSDSISTVMFNDSRGVSMAWLPDDKGLLYTQAPPTNNHAEKYYNGKIKLHVLGNDLSKDEIVFGIDQNQKIQLKPHETPYIYSFNHSGYLLARVRSGDDDNYAFAVHYTKLKGKSTPWKRLKNYINLGDGFDANDKYLYAGTNNKPGYNIVKIDMETGEDPQPFWDAGNQIISVVDVNHNSGIIAGIDVLYVLIRKIGDMQLMKIDLKSKIVSTLPLKYKSSINYLSLSGTNDLLFATFSATRTVQYFLYSNIFKELLSLPFAEKVTDFNMLQTEVVWVPSRDGKKIPVSLVYQKGLVLKNNNPILIEGYGNGGAVTDVMYDPNYVPWIKRGGIYAYAHVRGGGELGEDWTKDGQFPNKMNSINDVVDVAAYFVKQNYTSPNKQLIMGGSAGSFLVGNAVNQRPDLFKGGIFLSGLPDLVTHLDAAGGREQKSTGLLSTKEGFESRYSISSYFHIPPNKKLPAMLISHGATDYILSIHPVARYTAKLQEMQRGDNPILFLVDWESGHSGSQKEFLYILKFALWQTGHPDFQLKY